MYGTIFASVTLGFAILFTLLIMIYFIFEFRQLILKEKNDREMEMQEMARIDESESLDATSFSQVKLSRSNGKDDFINGIITMT